MVDDNPSELGKNKDFIDNQWQPGQSGNPGGRPKDTVSMLLKEKDKQKVADKLYQLALKGDMRAIQEYMDRTEGKVTDTHRFEGDAPVSIIYKKKE